MIKMSVPSRSRAFLVEFIIVILFFSIAAAIIIRVFVAAHELRIEANDLTVAMAKIHSIAEYAKASESKTHYIGELERLGAIKEEKQEEKYVFYYNKEWEVQTESQAHTYSVEIALDSKGSATGELLQIAICGSRVNAGLKREGQRGLSEIYQLQIAKYYAKSQKREDYIEKDN